MGILASTCGASPSLSPSSSQPPLTQDLKLQAAGRLLVILPLLLLKKLPPAIQVLVFLPLLLLKKLPPAIQVLVFLHLLLLKKLPPAFRLLVLLGDATLDFMNMNAYSR